MQKNKKKLITAIGIIAGIIVVAFVLFYIINFTSKFTEKPIVESESESEEGIRSIGVIRVLLLNKNSPYRKSITIECNGNMEKTVADSKEVISPNNAYTVTMDDFSKGDQIIFSPVEYTSGITLREEDKSAKGFEYKGELCLLKQDDSFVLINVVDTQEYLKSVVSSEIPASSGSEALKAQAICARSYVFSKAQVSAYPQWNAHIDDSVKFQAYQHQPVNAEAAAAVDATDGLILICNNKIATPMYYSTSCGYTSDVYEQEMSYLRTIGVNNTLFDNYCKSISGITSADFDGNDNSPQEAECSDFETYIKSTDEGAIESDDKYFRWNLILDVVGHEDEIKTQILQMRDDYEKGEKKSQNPVTISKGFLKKIIDSDGNYILDGFGEFEGMKVIERGKGGYINQMTLSFKNGSVTLNTEYAIRKVLAPAASSIKFNDGSTKSSCELLYSSAFVFERLETAYKVYGGGYGHGCGMSQIAAGHLAQGGSDCNTILGFFYPDTEITYVSSE